MWDTNEMRLCVLVYSVCPLLSISVVNKMVWTIMSIVDNDASYHDAGDTSMPIPSTDMVTYKVSYKVWGESQ